MPYTRSFFAHQLAFAERVAARFALPFVDAVRRYTPIAAEAHLEDDWEPFAERLAQSSESVELVYATFIERTKGERQPQPGDTMFREWPMFGCFYYQVLDGGVIRTHFWNNDLPGMRPLGHERQAARRDELRRLFTHVRDNVPGVVKVAGHSWLYNLPAYTRLFPPSYSRDPVVNPDGVLDHMVLWFQCYDRFWQTNPVIADEVLRRVDEIDDPADLRLCFPYQRLRTQAPIADFYAFYGIAS